MQKVLQSNLCTINGHPREMARCSLYTGWPLYTGPLYNLLATYGYEFFVVCNFSYLERLQINKTCMYVCMHVCMYVCTGFTVFLSLYRPTENIILGSHLVTIIYRVTAIYRAII